MDLEQAKDEFEKLLQQIDPAKSAEFILWIQRRYLTAHCAGHQVAEAHHKMRQIAEYIRPIVPGNAVLPSENIIVPKKGENADCDPATTVHLDAFLYDDEAIDELVEEGKLSRSYCKACGSHDTAPLTFLSHSASARRAEFIFREMVPYLKDKSVLDVGSRLGVMLYAAHAFTPANPIIGVEMNPDLCQIQETAIKHFHMDDRIKVINANVLTVPDLVASSDVVILNNVFEFFTPEPEQVVLWQFLRRTIKKGAILVTVPSLEDSLKNLQTGIVVSEWVKQRYVTDALAYSFVMDHEELTELCSYDVL
uniref:Methyltransferase type 11 domain-containing protein n=1 Tax=Rhipicephalus appendiculatus TaxID=34631 RepID=A0A131YY66_RHIAP